MSTDTPTGSVDRPWDGDACGLVEEFRAGLSDVRLYESSNHIGDWLRCIYLRTRPICDVEVGARSVTVCQLVNLAYHHRQRFTWDPVRETFGFGTGNPAWLKIPFPYRAPWRLEV